MTESLFSCFFLISQLKFKTYSMTMGIFSFKLCADIKQKQHSLCTNFGYLLTFLHGERTIFPSLLYWTEYHEKFANSQNSKENVRIAIKPIVQMLSRTFQLEEFIARLVALFPLMILLALWGVKLSPQYDIWIDCKHLFAPNNSLVEKWPRQLYLVLF